MIAEPLVPPPATLFEIRPTTEKGLGVFAVKSIPPGTKIVLDKPIFTTDEFMRSSSILQDIKSLSKEDQRKFLAFGNTFKSLGLAGIAKTNCVPMAGTRSMRMFETVSRMNHACRPTAVCYWDAGAGSSVCYALREIPRGGEITISYSNKINGPRRRHELKTDFGFDCRCNLCSGDLAAVQQSDDNLAELEYIIDEVNFLIEDDPKQALAEIKRSLDLIQQEGCFAVAPAQYEAGFQAAIAWGDIRNARAWATRAVEGWSTFQGPESHEVKRLKKLWECPREDPAWRSKGRRVLHGPPRRFE